MKFKNYVFAAASTAVSSILAAAALAFVSAPASAAFSPLAIGLFAPVQFPPSDFSVTGLRLNIFLGDHRDVYGVNLGLFGSMTEQQFVGLGVSGLFNYNKGATSAVFLQAAGVANVNVNKASVVGVQVAGVINSNVAESSIVGIAFAPVNLSPNTKIYGVSAGIYNSDNEVFGFQIGLINMVDHLHGLQIGLVNINRQGLFYIAPILNVGF